MRRGEDDDDDDGDRYIDNRRQLEEEAATHDRRATNLSKSDRLRGEERM